ncbi:ABC transporter ATP-binding protein [Ketobacter alkanivorans]|uniref:Multidrug ABC transporter ATP-binding protein n=1 Tax=Ketobacter alkanivorans TaxID=1917421 RepID=A0A2K9LHD8_9GAMM|nr:ABC transporter ATP-binding protein [Ketobacter alkanivorans]AUM11702.1 multidrug ABC transporter ATP-binding protein [Ketobacter alkanivorans]
MIRIDNLTKTFGQFTAVNGLSFSVAPGEVLGFLGPNGAGKSTTMKMITGFMAPTSGKVTVFGHDATEQPLKAKELIGYLPEGAPSYGDMTPRQFLNFIGQIRGFRGADLNARVQRVEAALQLSAVFDQSIETLSKGFKRRVGLAQAIIHDPKVLILDEPTDGLDPNQKQEVRSLIANLSKDKIVIVSTHILEEVSAVCSRAIIIAGGRILADGTPDQLEARSRYHGAVTMSLQSAANAESELVKLPEVASVEVDEHKIVVFPRSGAALFAPVNNLIQKHGWQVDELHVERGRLDEVFRTITGEVA